MEDNNEITDIKIRFSDRNSETWMSFFLDSIMSFDWKSQKLGVRNYTTRHAMKNGKPLAQIAFYRTKTLRVVYISAEEEFKY